MGRLGREGADEHGRRLVRLGERFENASTTAGSNCVPAHCRSSATASSGLRAGR